MQLAPKSRLGPYEITARIGAGGMGEVWRAHDSRLDRDIAIKVLPAEFANDAQFRLRFEREAKTISQLNHPNICSLYDVGDGYLVMELLEGESLADKIRRGPMPVEEVLRYGIQIASALDRAHRRGIVHRDLKPGNVMITREGAKLLDFGLAKSSPFGIQSSSTASIERAAQEGETQHKPLTAEGTIVGTFQYMAPEQIEGQEADARADIFALGALLYEMTTGQRAFDGKSRASLIASILDREPPPISQVQPLSPAALENVIRKCLAKDPEGRWQSAHDVKLQLQWLAGRDEESVAAPAKRTWSVAIAVPIVALIAGLAIGGGAWLWQRMHPERRLTRFSVAIAGNGRLPTWGQGGIAVSPDGRTIVWPGGTGSGSSTQLFIRTLDRDEAVAIDGAVLASWPFFSHDGQWIGFFSGLLLKKVPRGGGAAQTITKIEGVPLGAAWLSDSSIVYATTIGVYRVLANGSAPERLATKVGSVGYLLGDEGFRSPSALPDAKFVLCEAGDNAAPKIGIFSLKERTWRAVIDGNSPVYVDRLHALLFLRNGTLFAARFDPSRAAVSGPAVALVEGITSVPPYSIPDVGISRAGTIAYARGFLSAPPRMLVTVDRGGNAAPLVPLVRGFEDPRVSPDGKRVAVTIRSTADTDVWIADIERGILTRSTFDKGEDETPIWTPDGKHITFGAERGAAASIGSSPGNVPSGVERSITWQPSDGSGREEKLLKTLHGHAGSWSPDGKTVAFTDYRADFVGELWTWSAVDHQKRPFLANGFSTRGPMFSRDGNWIAYTSNESGRDEVYVRPFPGPGGVVQVSSDGGAEPVWSHRGDEMFFRSGDKLLAARVHGGAQFSTDPPRVLFTAEFLSSRRGEAAYDVMPDDAHFLMVRQDQDPSLLRINVVLDWFSEVEAKLKAAEQ